MTTNTLSTIPVFCVDDNRQVLDALRLKVERTEGFEWAGSLPDATDLTKHVTRPMIVVLDIDMPGLDPFDATAQLMHVCPQARVVVFSGHVRKELIERAIEAGAWGYVSKNDGEAALFDILRKVSEGEFSLSDEVRNIYG